MINMWKNERRLVHHDWNGSVGEDVHEDSQCGDYEKIEETSDHEPGQERNDDANYWIANMRDAIAEHVPKFKPPMFNLVHRKSPALLLGVNAEQRSKYPLSSWSRNIPPTEGSDADVRSYDVS